MRRVLFLAFAASFAANAFFLLKQAPWRIFALDEQRLHRQELQLDQDRDRLAFDRRSHASRAQIRLDQMQIKRDRLGNQAVEIRDQKRQAGQKQISLDSIRPRPCYPPPVTSPSAISRHRVIFFPVLLHSPTHKAEHCHAYETTDFSSACASVRNARFPWHARNRPKRRRFLLRPNRRPPVNQE